MPTSASGGDPIGTRPTSAAVPCWRRKAMSRRSASHEQLLQQDKSAQPSWLTRLECVILRPASQWIWPYSYEKQLPSCQSCCCTAGLGCVSAGGAAQPRQPGS